MTLNSHSVLPDPIDFSGMGQAIIQRYTKIDWGFRSTALFLTAAYGAYCYWRVRDRQHYANCMAQGDPNDRDKQTKAYLAREDVRLHQYRGFCYGLFPFIALLVLEYYAGAESIPHKTTSALERFKVWWGPPAIDTTLTIAEAEEKVKKSPIYVDELMIARNRHRK